jgi:hypothetical protein
MFTALENCCRIDAADSAEAQKRYRMKQKSKTAQLESTAEQLQRELFALRLVAREKDELNAALLRRVKELEAGQPGQTGDGGSTGAGPAGSNAASACGSCTSACTTVTSGNICTERAGKRRVTTVMETPARLSASHT